MPRTVVGHARYRTAVNEDDGPGQQPLVIEDCGPWDRHPTVTNDAEWVVADLVAAGLLPPGRRLFYYDSEGAMDEILVRDGRFAGFDPGPR